ncbi:MAG: hypothetical protein WCI05_15375 [Myxococcales bacterium]
MTVSSFLASGGPIPQGSAVTDLTRSSILPDNYTNYAMDILARQKAIADRPYETSPVPRVAAFTPEQLTAFKNTATAADAYQPGLAAATTVANNAAAAPGALSTAQPYLTAAGKSSVSNIDAYMNPYTNDVVNRIGELGRRNLTENLMPQIEGRYIQSGQLGYGGQGGSTSSGMMTDTARAVRDTSADILAQQSAALESGYNSAAGLAGTDLARTANLASTAGNFASTDKNNALSAANTLSGLAGTAQTLGLTGAGALGAVGAQEQQLNQKNVDLAEADRLRQLGYNQEQIDHMIATMKGVSGGIPTAETTQGISPGPTQPVAASTGAQVGSVITALGGVAADYLNKPQPYVSK